MPPNRENCTFKLIPLLSPLQIKQPSAIALGSFDGLHEGHRQVIKSIVKSNYGVPTVVSFWPHPREILYGERRLRLDLPNEKTYLLELLGIKQLVLIPFDLELASQIPEEFIEKVLHKTLRAKEISIGENFHFGKDRTGNAIQLKKIANNLGIKVNVIPITKDSFGRMSSSRIREALKEGDLKTAKKLLGRPYSFKGKVIKGKGIGKKIGWPTANLEINGRKFLPKIGVYAAVASLKSRNFTIPAVMNLGPQPTIDPDSPSKAEVHLINTDIDLYGDELKVIPTERIRGQIKFESLEMLTKQIKADVSTASKILNYLTES